MSQDKTAISKTTAKYRQTGWGGKHFSKSSWAIATRWMILAACVGFTGLALEYRWALDFWYYVLANLQVAITVWLLGKIFLKTYEWIRPKTSRLFSWVVVWLVGGVMALVFSIVLAFCLPLVSAFITGGDIFHSGGGVMVITFGTTLVSVAGGLLLTTILTIRDTRKSSKLTE
jgi:hypothetical protein